MVSLHCIHGFLGRSTDWNGVLPTSYPTICYDLLSKDCEKESMDECGKRINQSSLVQCPQGARVLVGYSMGGRIALHALLESPELWSAGIIISAHPGLASEPEKVARFKTDQIWAERFRKEPWESLMEAWNSQSVLSAGKNSRLGETSPMDQIADRGTPVRREIDFSRRALSRRMEDLSLGVQRNLRPELAELSLPILWISGESDDKFRAIAEEMSQLNRRFCTRVLKNAGHRVPWDQPEVFKKVLVEFLDGIFSHK